MLHKRNIACENSQDLQFEFCVAISIYTCSNSHELTVLHKYRRSAATSSLIAFPFTSQAFHRQTATEGFKRSQACAQNIDLEFGGTSKIQPKHATFQPFDTCQSKVLHAFFFWRPFHPVCSRFLSAFLSGTNHLARCTALLVYVVQYLQLALAARTAYA